MLYFIPAWYQQNEWCENEQSWWEQRAYTEFDDTVKQIQLFHRSKAHSYQILVLSYAPNFRHFLHRQGVYRASYWSCFDAIQEVRRKKATVLSFHQLKWPEKIEFIYTPFVVVAMLDGKKYAQIDFGQDGNLIRIDLYKDNEICRRNLYDDRGFISSTVLYENGQPIYQDYLMENGVWKLRQFKKDGHVEINPKHPEYLLYYQGKEHTSMFFRLTYDDIEKVICEVFMSYLHLTEKEDIFCVAMHKQHVWILSKTLKRKKLILSFYSGRPLDAGYLEAQNLMKEADYIIADSGENLQRLKKEFGTFIKRSIAIPPYDSRIDSGISQQFNVQKILVAVDDIEGKGFDALISLLGKYLLVNENARIHLFTRRADYDRKQKVLDQVQEILEKNDLEIGWVVEKNNEKVSENNLEPEEPVHTKFFVEQCIDELAVSKCMREQRLFIDLRKVPELYLQITAISFGIPQIVRTQTEFIRQGKNGIVLKNISMLPTVINYYLDGLQNWNQARVYSYEMVKNYSSDKLLEKWGKVIDTVGKDSHFTVRRRRLEQNI